MKISSSAASLNVEDVAASSAFLVEHFGFQEDMAADGFAPSRWVIPTELSCNSSIGMEVRNAVLDEVVLQVEAAG